MTSWVDGASGSAYDVDNLPYGVFSRDGDDRRVGVRIGDHVVDVSPLAAQEHPELVAAFATPSSRT